MGRFHQRGRLGGPQSFRPSGQSGVDSGLGGPNETRSADATSACKDWSVCVIDDILKISKSPSPSSTSQVITTKPVNLKVNLDFLVTGYALIRERSRKMKVFFDEECLLHHPPYEILSGKLHDYYETPKRILQIRQALEGSDVFHIEHADRSIDVQKHALQVHSEDYMEHLEFAFRLWVEGGGDPKVGIGSLVFRWRSWLIGSRIHSSQIPFSAPSSPLNSPQPVRLQASPVKVKRVGLWFLSTA